MCPDYFGPGNVTSKPYYGSNLNGYAASYAANLPLVSCAGYDPLNMNYSIYGSDIDLTSDYSIGGGYGPMAGAYGYNPETMYQYMDKWTDYMYDRNVKYTEKGRSNDLRINGPVEAVQNAADALREKVVKDEQSQIPQFFEAYKNSIKALYPEYANLNDRELTARALEHYKQRNNGVSLKDEIRQHGRNIFAQKFINTITFGGWAKGSAEETIEKITGNPMSRDDKVKADVGFGAGVAAIGGAGVLGVKNFGKICKTIGRGGWVSAIIAAGIAAGFIAYNSGSK